MNSQSLLKYWKESLDIFISKGELKLYLLGTLLTFKRALTIIVKKFWWLLFLQSFLCALFFALKAMELMSPDTYGSLNRLLLSLIAPIILSYLAIMTTRPSLEAKNYNYFIKYLTYIWPLILYFIAAKYLPIIYRGPLSILFIALSYFFFFDSSYSPLSLLASLYRSLKLSFFFFPAYLILSGLLFVTSYPFEYLMLMSFGLYDPIRMASPFNKPLILLVYLLIVFVINMTYSLLVYSAISVFYTKLKHKYYNLLFGQ